MSAVSLDGERVVAIERYLTSPLYVLALWQPYATLCVAPDPSNAGQPPKRHETRHFAPRLPRPFCILIHATKTVTPESRAAFQDQRVKDALRRCGFYPGDPRPLLDGRMRSDLKPAPLGAIVGVATVSIVYQTPGMPVNDRVPVRELRDLTPDDLAFGNYEPERFAWLLKDAVMLPQAIPFSGRQDVLYSPDRATQDAVHAQVRGLVAG
jgi:hypothetical protein